MIHLEGLFAEIDWDGELLDVHGRLDEGGSYVDGKYQPHTHNKGEWTLPRADIAKAARQAHRTLG